MSGSSPTPAEQHLGDRLAALVDGELDHDERERVLSHLATCAKCKAEADCQRRLKTVFAEVAPPPPSAGFLARLQGLPGGPPGSDRDDDDDRRGLLGAGGFTDGLFDTSGPHGGQMAGFGYASAGVFPIHEIDRQEQEQERSAWRGKRFAFAAASAVSLAAMALGGATPAGTAADSPLNRDLGNNVTPVRAPGVPAPAAAAAAEAGRREGVGGFLPQLTARARAVASPGTLQARNLSAGTFESPFFGSPSFASPSFPSPPFGSPAFPAEAVNSSPPAPLAGPTGSALQVADSASRASGGSPTRPSVPSTPHPGLLVGPTPLSAQR